MKKPNIFVVGPSGTGKSTSLENLDPKTTVVLNVEQKQLPFRKARLFEKQKMIATLEDFYGYFQSALKGEAQVIVIESFTSLCEMIMTKAKKLKTGYDVFNYYNDEVSKIISMSKNTEKYVIFLGIDETEQDDSGQLWHYVKVEGKKLRGYIEKEFVIVLYTQMKYDESGKPLYQFITNAGKGNPAKSPKEMLDSPMPNDLQQVINKSEEYYKE